VLFLTLGCTLLLNCAKDDSDFNQENTINGTWYLINQRGGFGSLNFDYSKGEIKWIFNEADNTLTEQNRRGNDNSFNLFSGTYTYRIEQTEEAQMLFVNDEYIMIIISIDKSMSITDNFNDGYTATFKR
jgi:hypothetical protein